MAKKAGAHTLSTPSGTSGPSGDGGAGLDLESCGEGCVGCLGYIGALLGLMIVALVLSVAMNPSRSPPTRPSPPASKAATFTSRDGTVKPISVQLVGGNYDVVYITITSSMARKILKEKRDQAFIVDFEKGVTSGPNLLVNDVIIFGRPNLHVDVFDPDAVATSDFIIKDGVILRAALNHAAPPTGPPSDSVGPYFTTSPIVSKRTVYIVDGLENVTFEGMTGKSVHNIIILELDPTEDESDIFQSKMNKYRSELGDYELHQAESAHGSTERGSEYSHGGR